MQSSKMRIGQSIVFAMMAMAGSLASALLVDTSPASALYTNAQIEQRLRNGIATAHSWDDACRDTLSQSPSSSFNGNLRALINGDVVATDASYSQGTWFSERNQPNVSSPITVISGTTSINLQLNSVQFICGPLVNPNVTTNNFTAQQLLNQSQRWVTATNARDRNPNPVGNVRTLPAKTGVSYRYSNLTITVGGGNVAWDGGTGPTRNLLITRDNNSRYWFAAPVNVRYNDPSGITSNRTITIRANYNTISTYNNSVHRCTAPAGGVISVGSATAFGSCREYTATYTLMINVTSPPPDYNHVPSMASLPASVVAGASINNVSATVQNTGSQASPASTVWRITRFVVPAGQTLADNPAYVAGDPACSRFINHDSCSNPVGDIARSFAANSTTTGLGTYNDTTTSVPAGSSICYVASVRRASNTVSSRRFSTPQCVTLQDNPILLTPSVTIAPNPVLVGAPVTSTATISRSGGASDGQTNWQYRLWRDEGNGTYEAASDESVYYQEGSNEMIPGGPGWSRAADPYTPGDLSFAQICASLRIIPVAPSVVATGAANPAITCLPIGKRPLVQISGGDVVVRASGSIVSAPSAVIDGARYGSWAEYGIFGPAEVTAYSGAALMADPVAPVEGLLTFANTTDPPTKGHFGSLGVATQPTLPDWPDAGSLPANPSGISNFTPNRISKLTGNFTINASTGLTGSYVIDATGHNIHIAGNIIYRNGPYGTDDDLPQVIIKAANITIAPGVHRIDAWLIASGVINTCRTTAIDVTPYFDGLSSEICDEKLTINGPMITNRLLLRRTHGADGTTPAGRREPAEVLNLRSDAYLWAYGQATSTQMIRTETVRDLAPRF